MENKLKEMMKLTHAAGRQSVGMQRRLVLYWMCMVLAVFAALLVVLSAAGVFSGTDQKLYQALLTEQSNVSAALQVQQSALTAQGVALSQQITYALNDALYTDPASSMNDRPDRLLELEKALYAPLSSALRSSPCSGAFLVLDATTNTSAPGAETSRAGLYLRFANLSTRSAANQDVVFFRGVPEVARENRLELHNRWNLEFDTGWLPGYDELMGGTVSRLADGSRWSGRLQLTDTWEDVLLLTVPVVGSGGTVQGLCGVELSDLYFRLSYPAYQSEFGSMVTVLAPMEDGRLMLDRGLTGGLEGTYLSGTDTLTVREGKYFNTYTGESGTFLGLHTDLGAEMDGSPAYAVTLLAQESYTAMSASGRWVWVAGSLGFLALMLALAVYLSRCFVQPISRSLAAIQAEQPLETELSGIQEIDELMAFIRSKSREQAQSGGGLPPDIEELFRNFAQRVKSLTPAEYSILQYYIAGHSADEIPALAFISASTVKKHNRNIYKKLEVSTREELMFYIELFRRSGRLDELSK